jgi:hypothetical protein
LIVRVIGIACTAPVFGPGFKMEFKTNLLITSIDRDGTIAWVFRRTGTRLHAVVNYFEAREFQLRDEKRNPNRRRVFLPSAPTRTVHARTVRPHRQMT